MKINRNICSCVILFSFVLLFFFFSDHEVLGEEAVNSQNSEEVKIISNPKTPSPKDGVKLRIVFEEELSIGVEEGDENYMFGGRVYFNTDDEGNIYVNDWDRKRIQKFDPQGQYLLTIGRRGRGPGEFVNARNPRFDKDGNLYVFDRSNHRISFFTKEGEYLRQISLPQRISIYYIYSNELYFSSQSKILTDSDVFSYTYTYGIFDKGLNQLAEVYSRTVESKRDTRSRAHYLANIYSGDAYDPELSFLLDGNEFIYLGYPEKYEIKIFSPEGNEMKIIQREYDPIKIGKKHKEDFIKYLEDEYFRFTPRDEALKKDIIGLIKYPKYLPAYQTFTLMENGWLFVVVDTGDKDAKLIDVFDQDGKYIAQFTTSISTDRLIFKNGKAYAIATENDFRYVKRYEYEIQEFRNNEWIKNEL
jgi:hypothetical protein